MKRVILFFIILFISILVLLIIENNLSISFSNGEAFSKIDSNYFYKLITNDTNISDEMLSGKVIVLNFWATWCKPCINEIPVLNNLVERFKNEEVIFFAITKEDSITTNLFLKNKNIHFKYIQLYKQEILYNYFHSLKRSNGQKKSLLSINTEVLPLNIVIDKKGQIIYFSEGFSQNNFIDLEVSIIKVVK